MWFSNIPGRYDRINGKQKMLIKKLVRKNTVISITDSVVFKPETDTKQYLLIDTNLVLLSDNNTAIIYK